MHWFHKYILRIVSNILFRFSADVLLLQYYNRHLLKLVHLVSFIARTSYVSFKIDFVWQTINRIVSTNIFQA